MIATSGDEAFIMLSLFPEKALLLFLLLAIVGFVSGIATDFIAQKYSIKFPLHEHTFEVHENETCPCFSISEIFVHLKNITFPRALLIVIFFILIALQINVFFHEEVLSWINVTLLVTAVFGLFVVTTVPDHFLEKHLWEHVLRKHLFKVFLWTLGTLAAIHFLDSFIEFNSWVESNHWVVLVVAVLIGLVPESGPHIVFVTLFVSGTIPFSILMASSIVQDGHGTIPLLALSKKSFILLKMINLIVGFSIGAVGLLF